VYNPEKDNFEVNIWICYFGKKKATHEITFWVIKGLFNLLVEDNTAFQLSTHCRLTMEAKMSMKSPNNERLDKIYSANLVRLVADSQCYQAQCYNIERLNFLGKVAGFKCQSFKTTSL
jgi:hypothetical protein